MLMRLIRSLSLDIVAGGVAGAAFAAHVTGARMPDVFWLVLPAAIWIVYTLDHLIDGLRAGPVAANERHAFHARHARPIALVVVVAGVATGALAMLRLPMPLRFTGALLGAAVVLYLAAVLGRFPGWLPREVAVALLYVAGIWIGPLALSGEIAPQAWLMLALHGATALAYLFAYAWFEAEVDGADGSPSIARTWGCTRLDRVLTAWTGLVLITALAGSGWPGADSRIAFLTLAVVGVVPWLLIRFEMHLTPLDRYRNAEWTLLLLLVPPLLARFG